MSDSKYTFTQLSDGAASIDGQKAKVRIHAAGIDPMTIEMSHDHLSDIIQYLALIAVDAAKKRGGSRSFEEKPANAIVQIAADQIGLVASSTGGSAIFVVRIAELDLGFDMPRTTLRGLADAFSGIAATLEPGPTGRH